MTKILLHGLTLVGSFFALWFGLAQVDWMTLLRVERAADATEAQVGKAVWEYVSRSSDIDRDPALTAPLDTLLRRLCVAAGDTACPVRVYVVRDREVNAFALPDGRMLITTGLLNEVQNESELAGVIGHEYAHIEGRHVMNKLAKEIGLAVLISSSTGGGADMVQQVLQSLSSTAYDRRLESESDRRAVDLLIEARIDPTPFGDLTYRLGQTGRDPATYLRWLSTHPEPEARSLAILDQAKDADVKPERVLTPSTWARMKQALTLHLVQ